MYVLPWWTPRDRRPCHQVDGHVREGLPGFGFTLALLRPALPALYIKTEQGDIDIGQHFNNFCVHLEDHPYLGVCFVHTNNTWTTDGKAVDDKRYSPWSMVLATESLPLLVVAHNLVLSKRGKLSAASVKVLSTFDGMHRTLTHYTTHDTIVD